MILMYFKTFKENYGEREKSVSFFIKFRHSYSIAEEVPD